ncbi:MAG: zinc-ribbon domain-containing protein [Fimbriimonas sp.]
MECPRCGKSNPDSERFCARCGTDLTIKVETKVIPVDEVPCYRHKNEMTALACGKCGRPVCYRCAINGPAGIRCPDCGVHKIPFTWRGFFADITLGSKRTLGSLNNSPYRFWIWFAIISLALSVFRGCTSSYEAPDRSDEPSVTAPSDTGNPDSQK